MANLQRLLTRRPQIDEAEVEDVRERTMARLAALNDGGGATETTEPVAVSEAAPETVVASDEATAPAGTTTHTPTAAEPAPAPAKPAGPKIIVPRTISLGPPPAPAAEPEPHRAPPIIVLGEPTSVGEVGPESLAGAEVEAVVEAEVHVVGSAPITLGAPTPVAHVEAEAEPTTETMPISEAEPIVAAEAVVEPVIEAEAVAPVGAEPLVAEPLAVEPVAPEPQTIEPDLGAPSAVVVEPEVVRSPKAKAVKPRPVKPKAVKAKAVKPRATRPGTPASAPRSTTAKPTGRPATAIPVVAQPEPVIEPGAEWPGRWPAEMAPDAEIVVPPTTARRDPSLPVPRVAVVADEWDRQEVAAHGPVVVQAAPIVVPAMAAASALTSEDQRADQAVAVAEVERVSVADPIPIAVVESPVPAEPIQAKATVPTAARATPAQAKRRPAPKAPTKIAVALPPVQTAPAHAAFCPYCALALEPPPTASRRCTRCKQRIVVKRVQGRVVYLTEAAVEVFESERIRSANFGRWSKERAQWLKLATSVRADPSRIERLAAAPLSVQVVASAKTLYTSTAERQYRDAKREDRWEDASRLKRDQAGAMHRLAGSPAAPTADVLAMHREAVATELRGIGKMAKEASLVGSDCCDPCRADDGRTFKIAAELRTPRLPHDGCPKGLCHCRWDLTIRDRDMVQRYLRRTVRPPKAKRPSA